MVCDEGWAVPLIWISVNECNGTKSREQEKKGEKENGKEKIIPRMETENRGKCVQS